MPAAVHPGLAPPPISSKDAIAVAPRAHLFGVSAAMVTPFDQHGGVDGARAAAHARHVRASGADGVTLFGTTGEGASLGEEDRGKLYESVLGGGVPPEALTACICATAVEDAVAQARQAFAHGVRRLLLCPPFYFKGVSDDALAAWFGRVLDRIASQAPQVILYHIPQVTAVPLAPALIRRIKDAHGEMVFGVKDSAGDWAATQRLLPMEDLAILVGDERLLAQAAPLGGAGAISGIANFLPGRVRRLVREGAADPELDALVDEVVKVPVTPLVKALTGLAYGETGWERTRPPLEPSDPAVVDALRGRVEALLVQHRGQA